MENGIVNLTRSLMPRLDTEIACLTRRGAFADRLPAGTPVHVLKKGGGFSPGAVFRLIRLISSTRPDFLHTHNLGPLIYGALATGFGRFCPIVHGEHSMLRKDELQPRRVRQRRTLYRACTAIHTVAPAIQEELVTYGCPHPHIETIPNGVDTTRFCPGDRIAARNALNLPPEGLLIGLVGRFGAQKGHHLLLEAFQQVADRDPRLHLIFAGAGGPLEAETRNKAAQSRHTSRIHFTGLVGQPELIYRALDLLVIPSTNEGMANVAIEAMACECPVLGNFNCGHEAFLTPGLDGLLADLTTTDLLVAGLLSALENPSQLASLGRHARSTIEKHYALPVMTAAYDSFYRRSLALRRPSPR